MSKFLAWQALSNRQTSWRMAFVGVVLYVLIDLAAFGVLIWMAL